MSVLPSLSVSIAELLSSPFLFRVPPYQRPFSWNVREADQLFEDLSRSAGLDDQSAPQRYHFLGAMLLMQATGSLPKTVSLKMAQREFDVVDGQQRLMTVMTLLAVLRDLEGPKCPAISRRIQAMLAAQTGSRFSRVVRSRLLVNGSDSKIFDTYILAGGGTLREPGSDENICASSQQLLDVRDHLKNLVETLDDHQRSALFDYLCDFTQVVIIVSSDIDTAYQHFVVINERGKQLERNDILKADILGQVSPDQRSRIAKEWDALRARSGNDFDSLFSHIRVIFGERKENVVAGIRSLIPKSGGAEAFFDDVLIPYGHAFSVIQANQHSALPAEVRQPLTNLRRFSARGDWAPLALQALRHLDRDPKYTAFLLNEIERFVLFVRVLLPQRTKCVQRCQPLLEALAKQGHITSDNPALQFTKQEQETVAYHLQDLHRRFKKSSICKLLLLRLSDEMAGQPTKCDPARYTIEHVLPRTSSAKSEWRVKFPTPEERDRAIEALGNLVLISPDQNIGAGNDPWSVKRQIYAKEAEEAPLLAITADALRYDDWTPEAVADRTDKILATLEGLWRVKLRRKSNLSAA